MGPTAQAIARRLLADGARIVEASIPGAVRSHYDRRSDTIVLPPRLAPCERRAALMHEAMHRARGDDGHRRPRIEDRIDEHVARALVSPAEYAAARLEFGCDDAAVAAAIDQPAFVVRACARLVARARAERA